MKVFVATTETQGQRKNDFSFVKEGELVTFGFECDGEDVDGSCGCRRCMSGVETHKATTTFKVANLPLSKEEYTERIIQSGRDGGWVKDPDSEGVARFKETAEELLTLAEGFPLGVVLEKRGNGIQARRKGK